MRPEITTNNCINQSKPFNLDQNLSIDAPNSYFPDQVETTAVAIATTTHQTSTYNTVYQRALQAIIIDQLTSKSEICASAQSQVAICVLGPHQPPNTPTVPQARNGVQHLDETSAEPRVHVEVNEGIVAAVGHSEPVGAEPNKGQCSPGVHSLVVEHKLKEIERRQQEL